MKFSVDLNMVRYVLQMYLFVKILFSKFFVYFDTFFFKEDDLILMILWGKPLNVHLCLDALKLTSFKLSMLSFIVRPSGLVPF